MKVSIVTPSFNQVKFIEETILSVLHQTYADIEYIIIDGGSTDGSVEIIKKYEGKLTFWMSEQDNGQAHAINKGFEKCGGEIFAYLNSDDILEPNAVEKIVIAFKQNKNAAMVFGQCSIIDEYKKIIKQPHGAVVDFNWLLKHGMLPKIFQPACFFNKSYLTRKPIFREDLNFVMDYELLLWLLQKNKSVFIHEPIAKYRIHKSAKTISHGKAMYAEKLKVQDEYGKNVWWRKNLFRIKELLSK